MLEHTNRNGVPFLIDHQSLQTNQSLPSSITSCVAGSDGNLFRAARPDAEASDRSIGANAVLPTDADLLRGKRVVPEPNVGDTIAGVAMPAWCKFNMLNRCSDASLGVAKLSSSTRASERSRAFFLRMRRTTGCTYIATISNSP